MEEIRPIVSLLGSSINQDPKKHKNQQKQKSHQPAGFQGLLDQEEQKCSKKPNTGPSLDIFAE